MQQAVELFAWLNFRDFSLSLKKHHDVGGMTVDDVIRLSVKKEQQLRKEIEAEHCPLRVEEDAMKKYFFINGVAHEGKDGLYAKASECFDIQASSDGLWLHCPEINGKQESINLLQKDKYRLSQMLNALWESIREEKALLLAAGEE